MTVTDARLKEIPLFRSLNSTARAEIARRAAVVTYAPDAVMWNAGEEPRGLHVVLEGRVRIIGVMDGRPHVIHTEERGGLLGDVPLFGGGGYPATAVAERRTTCIVLSMDAIAAAVRLDSTLAFELLARLAGRVRHLISRLGGLASFSVKARLAAYLLERSRTGGASTFRLGCTQQALAEEVGTVREVVSRSLRELRAAGIITPVRTGVWKIDDADALREIARGS